MFSTKCEDKNLLTAGWNTIAVQVKQAHVTSGTLTFDLKLWLTDEEPPPPPIMRKEPYMIFFNEEDASGVQHDKLRILWQLMEEKICYLQWGQDPDFGTYTEVSTSQFSSPPYAPGGYDDWQHQHSYIIDLGSLNAGELYHFRVKVTDGGGNIQYFPGTFRVPPSSTDTELKFFVYGDTRDQTDIHNQVAEAIIDNYDDPDWQTMIINVGDIVSDAPEQHWQDELFDPPSPSESIKELLSDMPYQVCAGNHEGEHLDGYYFRKYFPYPFENLVDDNDPTTHDDEENYWSFDYGPAHFVMVDQYFADNHPVTEQSVIDQVQLDWIEADLAGTTKKWKFIVLHEPGWAATFVDNDPPYYIEDNDSHNNNDYVQEYIQPLCIKYDVAMVFAGHNHYYARADVHGIKHVTTGGGGAESTSPNLEDFDGDPLTEEDDTLDDDYVKIALQEYQYCRIEIDGDELFFQSIKVDGGVTDIIDEFTIKRYDYLDITTTETVRDELASFITNLQVLQGDGGIPDGVGHDKINRDSTMEYALIGLAAAYQENGNPDYLNALEEGIAWLAEKQIDTHNEPDVNNPEDWYGSWWYFYNLDGSPGQVIEPDDIGDRVLQVFPANERNDITNIRGVDTTTALFVYLLYLHYILTGDPSLVNLYAENAIAACDFLVNSNTDLSFQQFSNLYTFSSWYQIDHGDEWIRANVQLTGDQADVYLGLRAGSYLFPDKTIYKDRADYLETYLSNSVSEQDPGFFATNYDIMPDPAISNTYGNINCYFSGRYDYLLGDGYSVVYSEGSTFYGTFAQGYLPWVLGNEDDNFPNNQLAFNWITGDPLWTDTCQGNDYTFDFTQTVGGSTTNYNYLDYSPIIQYTTDPYTTEPISDDIFAMSSLLHYMAATSLDEHTIETERSLLWMFNNLLDNDDMYETTQGGIYDCLIQPHNDYYKYVNTAGFGLMALTNFSTLLEIPFTEDITTYTNWTDPVFIGSDITVDSEVTLDINTDVYFLGGYDFTINGTVNINEGASLNMVNGTNVEVNNTGTLFLDWGSTITGCTQGYASNGEWIPGDRIIVQDEGIITTHDKDYFLASPGDVVTIGSLTDDLWDGIFIKDPDSAVDYWFVNCDISYIRKLAIENVNSSGEAEPTNLKLFLTDFHDAEQIVVRDGHILTMEGTATTPCLITNSAAIKSYESAVNLNYVNVGESENGNIKPVYLYGSATTNSTITNCNFSYNNCDGFLASDVVISNFDNVTIEENTGFGMFCYDGTTFDPNEFAFITLSNNGYAEYAGTQGTFRMNNPNANITISDDNYGTGSDYYLLIDVDWDEHNPVDISGTNIESINHLLPTDSNAWSLSTTNGSAEILLETAEIDFANGNYSGAQVILYELLDLYLDSPQAVSAVYYLFHIEVLTTGDYADLRDYLDTLDVEEGTKLAIVIEKVKAKTLIKDGDYLAAIDILENIIINCNMPDEVVAAMIDQGYAYLELSESEERSSPERCTIRTATLDEYQTKVEELLTKFSFYPDEEKMKDNINSIPVIGKILAHCNYPNPFNPVTTIAFNISSESDVSITIYNMKGQKVKQLLNEELGAGQHTIDWNGKDENNKSVASGIYFYKIATSKDSDMRKMLLLK